MKYTFFKFFLAVILLLSFKNNSQHIQNIDAEFIIEEKKLKVVQESIFHNSFTTNLSNIIVYDWNNSYSSMDTPLAKKLYSEYDSSILKSEDNNRGKTVIKSILINGDPVIWKRVPNNQDLIELTLKESLGQFQNLKITFEYDLIIPNYILDYGLANNNYVNLKNCFFRFAPILNDKRTKFSNLGLDDKFLLKSKINLNLKYDSNLFIATNLIETNRQQYADKIESKFYDSSVKDFDLIFSKVEEFKSIDLNNFKIITNSEKILSLDESNFKNINDFFNSYHFDVESKKVIIERNQFKKNSLYPYSEIPKILDPFKNNSLNEINFTKNIIKILLSKSLNINTREFFWFTSGLELFYLEKYIDTYYKNLPLLGELSNFFLIKQHNLSLMKFTDQFKLGYKFVAGRNLNQMISLPSNELTRINYKMGNPSKSLSSLKLLKSYIGNDSFMSSLSDIFSSEKIIASNDEIKNYFEKNSEFSLDWFFDSYINYSGQTDFKIHKKKSSISIKNKTFKEFSLPIPLSLRNNDNEIFRTWITNDYELDTIDLTNIKEIIVDPEKFYSDGNYKNNSLNLQEKNRLKTSFTFFSDLDDSSRNQIFYRPQFIYNLYDGFSPGITLTNKSPFKKTLTYMFSPFYSTVSEKLIGNINLNYTNYNSKTFSSNYYLSLSKFHYDTNQSYFRISPTILFTKRDKNLVSNYRQYFRLKYINVNKKDDLNSSKDDYGITNISYINSNPGAKKSFSYSYDIQLNNEIIKNSITLNFRNFFNEFRQYNLRLFIGKFFKNSNVNGSYDFSVDNPNDYLFDNFLIGRSENTGFYSQQYIRYEGAFKSKINDFSPNDFILSINSGITIWKWFEAYFDFGLFKNKKEPILSGYDTGLRINIIENYLEVFFPVYSSNGSHFDDNSYSNKIRFVFTFDPENLTSLFTRRWF